MKKGRVKEELDRKERQRAVEKHKETRPGKKKEMEKLKYFACRTNARSLQGFVAVKSFSCNQDAYLFLFAHVHDCS